MSPRTSSLIAPRLRQRVRKWGAGLSASGRRSVPHRLYTKQKDFAVRLRAFLALRDQEDADVAEVVRAIIARVREEGDAALLALTKQFDRVTLTPRSMRITAGEIAKAKRACGKDVLRALEHAAKRIRLYHEKQKPKDLKYTD